MLKKTFILSLIFCLMPRLHAMHDLSQEVAGEIVGCVVEKSWHRSMRSFASRAGKEMRDIRKIFTDCEQKFGADAACAKMYLCLTLPPAARTRFEEFFKSVDPVPFLNGCTDFSFAGDEAWLVSGDVINNVFHVLRELPGKSDQYLRNWVRENHFFDLCSHLIYKNNIPCIAYLMRFLNDRRISAPELGEWGYELLRSAIEGGMRVITVRFLVDYFHLDVNHLYKKTENIEFTDGSYDEVIFDTTTPLFLAIVRGYVPLVRFLLQRGALSDAPIRVRSEYFDVDELARAPRPVEEMNNRRDGVPFRLQSAIDLSESFRPEIRSREIISLLHEYADSSSSGVACRPPCATARTCAIM